MHRQLRSISVSFCLLSLLFVGLLTPSSAVAQAEGEEIRTADYDVQNLTFPDLRDFQAPEPERMELDNGMIVFLLEDHELPQVNASARIGTGSVYEPAEMRGLASITGTVMRTGGTESMSSDSINQTLENIGATVETGIGGTAGSASMSTLAEQVDTVLPIFADVLRRPAFEEAKVQQAKSQQRSVISRRNEGAQQIAFREFEKLVYGEDSPYARHPEYYTINRIERQDLIDFHDQYYHPNNTILSVWGDFDAEIMKKKIRQHFGDWTAPEDAEPPTAPQPSTAREHSVNFVQKGDVTQSTIVMGHPGSLTRNDADYPSVTVMNEVLSGGFSGRLFQNVRREQGLAYSVFGAYTANYRRPGLFYAGVATKSGTTVEATEAVLTEVERMRQEPPTQEELGLAKDSYLNSFVFNFDTKQEVLSRLMTYEFYDYPSDFLQQTKSAIEDVTADDVHRVAQEYLYPSESHILVVGRRQDFSQDLSVLSQEDSVNEIDISIPQEPPSDEGGQATAAQMKAQAAGQDLIASVKEALGGAAFDQITAIRMVTNQQNNESTLILKLPDQLHTELNTPMGSVTVVDDGETMTMKTPQGTQTAPPSVRKQIQGQLWRTLPYLLTNLDNEGLTVEARGQETIDGATYEALRVQPPAGSAYTLYLDPETMRPQRMSLETMNPQSGVTVQVEQAYSDYQDVSGVTLPFTTTTTQSSSQGEQTITSTVEEFEVNPTLEQGLFTLEGGSSQ